MSWRAVGDWGTSNLRLYRLENGRITDRREGPGIGTLTSTPTDTLRQALAPWMANSLPASIDLCGMAGSRNGLHEIPYLDCPASADDWAKAAARHWFDGIPLRIAPGLACVEHGNGPDVMRGEEAQIFGALALNPGLRNGNIHIVLPGTHSKWVHVELGRIRDFRTSLSGELFALLRDRSILLALGEPKIPADEPIGFMDGVERAASRPGLVGSLFAVRAQQLRGGRSASWALGFLSGLVIGNEIADLNDTHGPQQAVILIGTAALTARYKKALARFGVTAQEMDGDASVLRGLELIDAHD